MFKKTSLTHSVFWLTLSEIFFNFSGYLIHSGVGRLLGPAGYGQYGIVVTLTTMIIILIGNGIPTAMSKYLSEVFFSHPERTGFIKKQAAYLQLLIIGLVTLLFYFLAPFLSYLLHDNTLTPLFRISSLIIPAFAAASFYFYYFTGIHQFNLQAILKTLRSVFKVIFILAFAWLWKVKGAITGYIFAPLSVFLIAVAIDYFWLKPQIQKTVSSSSPPKRSAVPNNFYRLLINYAWPFTLFTLFYEIMISIDLYMVKAILQNDTFTGIYNGALTVGRIPYYLFYALTIVLLPAISHSTAQKLNQKTKEIIETTLRLLVILLVPIIVIMFSFSRPIINLFYGSEYLKAAFVMNWLIWGISFLTIFYVTSFIFNGAGKVKIPMYLSLLGAFFNSVLSYYLIPLWQLKGAAIATSFTSFLVTVVILFLLYQHFQINFPLISLGRSLIAGFLMAILTSFFPQGTFSFIFSSLVLTLIYFGFLYILKEVKQTDYFLLKNSIIKSKK